MTPITDVRPFLWDLRLAKENAARVVFPQDQPQRVMVEISRLRQCKPWDVQLNQANLHVICGVLYRVQFQARADATRSAGLGFSKAHAPWDGLGLYQEIMLQQEWQSFTIEFTTTADDTNARLHFDLGGSEVSVQIDNVSVESTQTNGVLEPNLAPHGIYPANRDMEDWSGLHYSVIIPTYNRRDSVVSAVRKAADQDFPGKFELIVVTDGSTDGTADALRKLHLPVPLIVLEQKNQGAARARNHGAESASGDVLLFMDDDMEAHSRLLSEHDRCYRKGIDAVLGHIPLHPAAPVNFLTADYQSWARDRANRLSQPGAPLILQDLLTGQVSVRRTVFQALKGFDEAFTQHGTYGNEDLDFGHRLLCSGYQVNFSVYALTYHNYSIDPGRYLQQGRQTGRADVAFSKKYPDQSAIIHAPYLSEMTWVGRALKSLPARRPWSQLLMSAATWLALQQVRGAAPGSAAASYYYAVYEMEYWRGVWDAGGSTPWVFQTGSL